MTLDTIYNEDCLQGMKRIPDGSIDAVICDLPYGVLNKGNEGGTWDTVIPFDKLWEQYKRICKPTAAIVLFGQGMFTADLMHSIVNGGDTISFGRKATDVPDFLTRIVSLYETMRTSSFSIRNNRHSILRSGKVVRTIRTRCIVL